MNRRGSKGFEFMNNTDEQDNFEDFTELDPRGNMINIPPEQPILWQDTWISDSQNDPFCKQILDSLK